MIRPTVTFWHSLRTSSNANNEPLAKIALRRKIALCYFVCIMANTEVF